MNNYIIAKDSEPISKNAQYMMVSHEVYNFRNNKLEEKKLITINHLRRQKIFYFLKCIQMRI